MLIFGRMFILSPYFPYSLPVHYFSIYKMSKSTILFSIVILAIVSCFSNVSAGGLDACNLPAEQGNCLMDLQMYYYNSASKQCEEFRYGGCHGNANQFLKKEDCEAACAH